MRVAVIGAGTIGGPLITALRADQIPGAQLSGVLTRSADSPPAAELFAGSNLVVEAAGSDAVRQYGPQVIGGGRDLLVVSVGALADDELRNALLRGPGRLRVCAGAIGGLELLRAVAECGGLDQVRLSTRKHPSSLPMHGAGPPDEATEIFRGSAREAAQRYPSNLNVAATLALATVGLDRTEVRLISDPAATRTTHVIEASGDLGTYRFEVCSRPATDHPATSAVVPLAVISAVRLIAGAHSIAFA